jgi:hypothetical protein
MSKSLQIVTFAITLALGIALAFPFSFFRELRPDKSLMRHRFQAITYVGNRVRHAQPVQHNPSRGRVVELSTASNGESFVAIKWEVAPDNGTPGLRWYNQRTYQDYIIEEAHADCNY